MDGTGLGTDVLLVLFELLVPWFCCSDCICSAAEYNVDSFLEHTWARTLARVWDMTIWSTYWKKKWRQKNQNLAWNANTFFPFFVCKPLPSPAKCWFLCFIIFEHFILSLPPPQIEIALIGQKLNLFVMGKLSESWHTGVCTKMLWLYRCVYKNVYILSC